ncbi:hypothetical protein KJ660_04215 [Candidatus Micrarchaeota archaeon]|nr:hypothetical protein [Candidatus Micrarchaeota archaeon]
MKRAKYVFNEYLIEPTILENTRKNKNIIYGARAMNSQIGVLKINRPTTDFDIFSRKPKKSAQQLERELDKRTGGDFFYVKQAKHQGTTKVMNKGVDMRKNTRDDFGVADFTNIPKPKPRTTNINGIKYVTLSHVSKTKRKALKDKRYAFRHRKDREDLNLIKIHRKIKGRYL